MGRNRWLVAVLAPVLAGPGCFVGGGDIFDPDDDPDIVGIVPRSAVKDIDSAFDVSFYTTAGGYIGEILAVVGYNFNRSAAANRVVIDGIDCRVLNYFEIDNDNRFGALFFVVSNTVPVANARRLNVINGSKDSDFRPLIDVHRLAFASASSGGSVYATDVTVNPPGMIGGRDFSVPSNPDTMLITPDGTYGLLTSGTSLYCVLLANGALAIRADNYYSSGVGPLAISPDGKLLVAGVIPPGGSPNTPDLALTDTSFLATLPIDVSGFDGSISFGGGTTPAFAGPVILNLGGAFPGTFACSPNSQRLFATLSSSVVREWAVSGTTLTFTRDFTITNAAPFGIAVSPDGATALVSNINLNTVSPLDLVNNVVGSSLPAGTTPLTPVITTNGARAVVVNVGGTNLSCYDIASTGVSAHSPATVNLGASPGEIALSPDGPVGTGVDNQVLVINGNTINYMDIAFASGAISLASHTTGTYATTLKKIAVTPRR